MPRIDDQIQNAIQEGKFDNLPGKGKPLRLENNPHENPEWRLANKVLRDSGFSLPWMQLRQEIDAGIELARGDLRRAWEWRQAALGTKPDEQVQAEWGRARAAFGEQIARINKLIADYNLQTPSGRFQVMKLNTEREVEAITKESV